MIKMAISDKNTEPIKKTKIQKSNGEYLIKDNIKSVATTLIVDCWLPKDNDFKALLSESMILAADAAGMRNYEVSVEGDDKSSISIVCSIEEHIILHVDFKSRFATIDVLSRSGSMPHWALRILLDVLQPDLMTLTEHRRGVQH